MEWSLALFPALVAVAIVVVPGLLIAVAAGQKGFEAFGVAPAISIAVVAISAILAPRLGITWSLWVPLGFSLLLALLAAGITFTARRLRFEDAPHRPEEQAVRRTWFSSGQAWAYGALVIAGILLTRNITNAIGNPDWVSQTYDVNFHLNAIRYIVDTGNASSLNVASMTAGDNPVEFYPAAWHAIAALILQLTNADVPVIANTMSLVVGAFVWPLSVIYMVRNLFKVTGPTMLVTGAITAAFTGFPLLLIYFGVLYPNSLGVAVMPVGLALLAQLFRAAQTARVSTVPAVFLGILVALGTALAHPNAIMSLLVMVVPLFAFVASRQIVRAFQRSVNPWVAALQVAGMAGLLWLIWFLWGVVRPPQEAGGWEPGQSQSGAVGEFITSNPVAMGHLWLISLLVLAGIYPLLRTRMVWLVASWAYIGFFYVAIRSMSWEDGRDWFTGVWYHDPFRVASIVPVIAIPLAVAAVDALVRALIAHPRLSGLGKPAVGMGIIAALLTGGIAYGTQTATYMKSFVETSFWVYHPDEEAALLTQDEYDLLDSLNEHVPEDATIIVNPWTGAGLAYAMSDREVTAYHTNYSLTDDIEVLNQDLEEVLTNPEVCEVIERHNAKYALFFGHREVNEWINGPHTQQYSSLEYLADPEVIDSGQVAQVLDRVGGATLYEITACD